MLRQVLVLELEGDAEGGFQPSGLLVQDGRLLTVSDKHDDMLFVIDRDAVGVNVRPFARFEPPADEPAPFDYEGLSPAPGGGWLVVSEGRQRVLRVALETGAVGAPPFAARARWLTPSLLEAGASSGCLQTPNAGFEGIALAGDVIVLAGERHPRCLIELGSPREPSAARFWVQERSAYPYAPGREPDYSDLARFHDRLYALARNVHLIVRLERSANGFGEGAAFSYQHVEYDPRYMYQDRKFGMAEGLAIDEREVFVLLDNNGKARAADAGDHRPQLFVFERPPNL